VAVEIENQLAQTILDQTFRNPNDRRLEGTYLFPLPANAAVKDLSLYIDGKPVECEVIEAEKARRIYEDIVRRTRDPALLEYVGRDLMKLRIFPIEPHQVRRVRFAYSQVLRRDFGLTEFSYPLVGRGSSEQPIGRFSLTGRIVSNLSITSIYSPTHAIEFVRKDDRSVKFAFEKENHQPESNLKIYYAVSEKDLGAGLVTYREEGEPGYLLLMIAPRKEAGNDEKIDKDVTFVFDTSGSMSGEKIKQAQRALQFCLNSLRQGDRFNIIRFSTETERFAESLVPASEGKIQEALEFVDGFRALGGTALNDALLEALDVSRDPARPHLVVFLTDGKPTVGETDVETILRNVATKNEAGARVFVFGVDNAVNTHLLDRVSEENGGVSDYVTPEEDIEVKVSNFFSRVAEPVLTNLSLDCGDVKVSHAYPAILPDLFAGSQLTLIGRYQGSGKKTIVLKGRMGEKQRVFEYEVDFPESTEAGDFLPRLWAIRRIGHLVDEIRKNGENEELRDEIVQLGKKYAIATPYTSLLVLEEQEDMGETAGRGLRFGAPMPSRPWPHNRLRRAPEGELWLLRNGDAAVRSEEAPVRGKGAATGAAASARGGGRAASVDQTIGQPDAIALGSESSRQATMKNALAAQSEARPVELGVREGAYSVLIARRTREMKEEDRLAGRFEAPIEAKRVAGRTFYLREGVWVDSEYDGKARTINVVYGSDPYFDLLSKGKDVGKYLALGAEVIFRLDGKWYRIAAPEPDADGPQP
jgi:Ca-activated chloride channel family protein